jgi:hypothetical protein
MRRLSGNAEQGSGRKEEIVAALLDKCSEEKSAFCMRMIRRRVRAGMGQLGVGIICNCDNCE